MKYCFFYIHILTGIFYPTSPISAQWSFNLESGYGFATRSDDFEYSTYRIDLSHEQRLISRNKLGKGVNISMGTDYLVNSNLSIGLEINAFYGEPSLRYNIGIDSIDRYLVTLQGKMYRIIPKLKFQIPYERWSFFSEMGLITGFKGSIIEDLKTVLVINNIEKTFQLTEKHFGGMSLGLMNSIGVSFKINKSLQVNLCFKSFTQTYGPTKSELIAQYSDGINTLEDATIRQRYTIFKNNIIESSEWSSPDPDQPTTTIRQYYPFNSMGGDISFTYFINTKK